MYELLKKNRSLIIKLSKVGVIDSHWLRDLEMYEDFQALEINCTMCKYTILAEKYQISEDRVRKLIKELKGQHN